MENESDRIERGANTKASDILARAQADQVAQRRCEMDAAADRAKRYQTKPERSSMNTESVERHDRSDSVNRQIGGHSPDEIAALRVSKPSELRTEGAAIWEPVHRRNYAEFVDGVAKEKLKSSDRAESRTVWSDQIAPLSITAPEQDVQSERFWHHHNNSPDYYRRMAESYPKLREQLERGATPAELMKNPSFKDVATFWYGNPPLRLNHYKDSYFCDESGHHRVALAHRYQLEQIPAEIHEWHPKN